MAPIIRTCSVWVAAALLSTAAQANRPDDAAVIAAYARARIADSAGDADAATRGYSVALAARPDDATIAARAYRQALTGGDFALAGKAAAVLDAAGAMPADGRLLIVAEAVLRRDWPSARSTIDAVARDGSFDFMVPALRAWVAFGARDADPIAILDAPTTSPLTGTLASENRALLLLAKGRFDEGALAAQAIGIGGGESALPLRLAAAATLAGAKRRDTALRLLQGDDPALVSARAMIGARRKLASAVETPAQGIALLYLRVAGAVENDRGSLLSLTLARIAVLLDRANDFARLAVARQLAAAGRVDQALALVNGVRRDSRHAVIAEETRIDLLGRAGDTNAALAAARAISDRPGATPADQIRTGNLLTALDQHREAATTYDRALMLLGRNPDAVARSWSLWLLKGGALEQAGDWPAARAALQKAVALAPDQPIALNYLGYAQLERRENLPEATALIEKASALRPDDPSIADSLGWAHYQAGDLARAIPQLEGALAGSPSDPTINEHLGDAYWAAGRRYEARYAWRAAAVLGDAESEGRIGAKLADGPAAVLR